MSNKKRRHCRPDCCKDTLQMAGILLMSFGATTLCAFLFPVKVWIFILGIVLLFCGFLLLYN